MSLFPDLDPHSQYGSGSRRAQSIRIHADPDLKGNTVWNNDDESHTVRHDEREPGRGREPEPAAAQPRGEHGRPRPPTAGGAHRNSQGIRSVPSLSVVFALMDGYPEIRI